jgi:hypothetical protein
MGTSLNMNMFSSANAQGMGQYGNDPYGSSYEQSYGYDAQPYYGPQQQPSYDQPRHDDRQSSYGDYSDYKTKDKKYECRTGPFEGFFVSSVEFCDPKNIKKFDDRKDRDDRKVGPQGPPGPPGANGTDGRDGTDGTDGRDGTNGTDGRDGTNGTDGRDGTNGTDFDPCVACLLDALVKLDSGAIIVNVTAEVEIRDVDVNITVPLAIKLELASLLQIQLAETLDLEPNATIFEICAAIDEFGLDIDVVLDALAVVLLPIVTEQINELSPNLIAVLTAALFDAGGNIFTIPGLIEDFLENIDYEATVAEILLDVRASLELFEACLEATSPNGNGAGIAPIVGGLQLPTIQEMIPTIQQQNSEVLPSGDPLPTIQEMNPTVQEQNSQALPSGDPMLQLQSSLSPIL